MAILPEIETDFRDVETSIQPTLTYRLDLANKRVLNQIDGLDALVQAVVKRLSTEQYAYPIYMDYGTPLEVLIGQEFDYVKSVIEHRIKDSLLKDDRINEIENFELQQASDKLIVSFDVMSYDGFFSVERQVTL